MSEEKEGGQVRTEEAEQPVFAFEGTLDGRTYERAVRSVLIRRVLVMGAFVLAIGLIITAVSSALSHIPFFWDAFSDNAFIWVLYGVVYLLYVLYIVVAYPRAARKRLFETTSEIVISQKIYEDRIESSEQDRSHNGSFILLYAEVRRRVITGRVIVLYRKRRSGITIYKALIPETDIPKVTAFLKERCSR